VTFPPVPLKAKAAGVLGACLISFVIGHGTRKVIEVEHVREVQVQAERKIEAAKAETTVAKREAAAARTRTVVHTVYVHGEPVEVTKEVVREVEKHHEEQAAQVVTKVVHDEHTVFVDRAVEKTVAAPLPRWSVGVRAGLNLEGRLQYGGELGRRLGPLPLWLTAGADVPNRAALLGLRLEW
jgi:hypothetical protein